MKIVTSVVNNPTFIELQYNSLKKFVSGDYEYIVFNDAKDFPDFTNGGDTNIKYEIESVCKKLNIQCINIPNNHQQDMIQYLNSISMAACLRTEDSLRFILDYQIKNPDRYLGIDSDMFLINNFDTNKYENYLAAIVPQYRNTKKEVHYFWNGLYYFDFNKIKNTEILNWSGIPELSCDSGGMMKDWLSIQNEDDLYKINHLWSNTWDESNIPDFIKNRHKLVDFFKSDPRNINGKFWCEIYDNLFLHYRAGGNWNNEGMDFHITNSNKLKDSLLDIFNT